MFPSSLYSCIGTHAGVAKIGGLYWMGAIQIILLYIAAPGFFSQIQIAILKEGLEFPEYSVRFVRGLL